MTGGTCWTSMKSNARCTSLFKMNVSREECCSSDMLAKSETASWSEGEMTSSMIFLMHLQGGVPCKRCKGNVNL